MSRRLRGWQLRKLQKLPRRRAASLRRVEAEASAAATPVVYPVELIHRAPPKLAPPKLPLPDIPDIMDRAWAFLEPTFKEVMPELEKAYMFFDYKAGRSTIITLSTLKELCRLTNKPMEGRAVVAKAINAVRRELQGHLEREQLLWPASQLTLAYVRQRALEIEKALRTSELDIEYIWWSRS
jgi:hypothetical protein